MTFLANMTTRQRNTAVTFIGNLLILLFFVGKLGPMIITGQIAELPSKAVFIAVAIGIVVVMVAGMIVAHVIAAIVLTRRDGEAAATAEIEAEDERDRLNELKGMAVGFHALSGGLVGAIVMYVSGFSLAQVFVFSIFLLLTANILADLRTLLAYREAK